MRISILRFWTCYSLSSGQTGCMKSHVRDVKFWSFLMKTKWTFFYQKYVLAIFSWCKILLNPNEIFLQVYFLGYLRGAGGARCSPPAPLNSHIYFTTLIREACNYKIGWTFAVFQKNCKFSYQSSIWFWPYVWPWKLKKLKKQFSVLSELCNMFLQKERTGDF